jgi:alpha-L-rhamnosidase
MKAQSFHGTVLHWLVAILSLFYFKAASANESLTNLTVNYQEHPLGIDIGKPSFGWQMSVTDNQRGSYQTAFQIVVNDEFQVKVWDSGKVKSDRSAGILYDGHDLTPTTRYDWMLTVWNQNGKPLSTSSWFETGLHPGDSLVDPWGGAQWIGAPEEDLILYSHYLPVFKIDYQLQLDQESQSTRASFLFGANDRRLRDKNKNLHGIANGMDQSYIAIELDISPLEKVGGRSAQLHIYRVGYAPDDSAEKPFKTFDIPREHIDEKNTNAIHQIYQEVN